MQVKGKSCHYDFAMRKKSERGEAFRESFGMRDRVWILNEWDGGC